MIDSRRKEPLVNPALSMRVSFPPTENSSTGLQQCLKNKMDPRFLPLLACILARTQLLQDACRLPEQQRDDLRQSCARRNIGKTKVRALLFFVLASLSALGCASKTTIPLYAPLAPAPLRSARMPDEADFAARDLLSVALLEDRTRAAEALAKLRETTLQSTNPEDNTKFGIPLVAYAQNLVDSMQENPRAYRNASRTLLKQKKLPKSLRTRLEYEVEDDPMLLSKARLRDDHQASFGQVFNMIAVPAGRSMMSASTPIVGFVRSFIEWSASRHLTDDFSIYERQALHYWEEELRREPDSEDAPELTRKVEIANTKLRNTRRDQELRKARRALRQGDPRLALAFSESALRNTPEDSKARRLGEKALQQIETQDAARARSLEAPQNLTLSDPTELQLAVALLGSASDTDVRIAQVLTDDPKGPWADEARFALAMRKMEQHEDVSSWKILQEAKKRRHRHENMTLHAKTLLHDPAQNPLAMFQSTRKSDGWFRTRWILFGPLARGARDRDLPRTLEWILDAPYFIDVLVGMPERIVRYPWLSPWPFGRAPSYFANQYLARYSDGKAIEDVEEWLEDYEKQRGNWIGAHEMASRHTPEGVEPSKQLLRLEKKAAEQALASATQQTRLEVRIPMLQEIVRRYPKTEASRKAGLQVRAEVLELAPQAIRVSRGFLEENPELAGPNGLGLRPELLDGNPDNGELHPRGVTFEGGNTLAVHYLNERGKKKEAPVTVRQQISAERLAEIVARLEERSLALTLLDRDYEHLPDAQRDLFFERARLGVAEEKAPRHAARSTFAFLGMREKYGLVRGRESILPIELVLQSSASDLSLGAFPRIKEPKKTPDSIFFE